ncbi:receptor-like protein kinase THESEUS 1 [Nicotiana tabacum]|uniref:Receptor-like protein kinase THESEUS 1 n=1 Tax=Nicotiana tabacum TaxID=4097 RepID=A0A1S3X4V5_TOBAC|nr:PREDICTED: receptor-like protein kinase THESEUS 1 [Nicotiana tabacum]
MLPPAELPSVFELKMMSLKRLFFASIVCFLSFSSLVCASFTPVDCFLISCGGSKSIQVEDGRVFEPDFGDSDVGLSTNSLMTVSNSENGLSELHNSARVFTKSSVYTISTKEIGRHWLRLHFYPVKNNQHNLKSAVFSVVANGITLLHEFSFSKLGKIDPLLKEYVVEIGGSSFENLVLTLTPASGSIAFINGIEVVSIPEGQFDFSVIPIPMGPGFVIPSSVALETAYRVNMGGPKLTPRNDTLWRIWNSDHSFLVHPSSARNVTKDPKTVKYPAGESVDIAPNWVYSTAQEMADAKVMDQKFNITWAFQVEHGFTYFIRMHFCDVVSASLNNLIFDVYINNQTAVESLDISTKTMALSAAYFADFVVNISTGSDKLFVQVGPSNLRTTQANAILNGLEIMKMSNPSNSLDGEFVEYSSISKRSNTKKHVMVAIFATVGGLAGLLLIAVFYFLCFVCFRKPKVLAKQKSLSWLSFPNQVGLSETKISAGSFASTTPSRTLGRIFAFSEIREATKDFDESLVIGVGGFGKVYKGVLENGVMVAVKRGNSKSQQGLVEFRTEIEMLSKLRHRHLVSLIGYCEELNEMILVYEFMAGGPLRKHLYGSDIPHLSWKQRLEVCIGAAKGLHYLHTGAAECIIHRDVKTTNILLDENLTAKVADFGLSKFGPALDQTHVSTAVKGSFGYLDPEYYRRQQLTEKSDVYSFGVVLMEVLCARSAINPSLPREQVNIAEWAMHWQKKGQLEQIIDPYLVGKVSIDSLRKYGETAEKCLAEYGCERPSMGDVLWNLEYALHLQEAATQSLEDENSHNIPDIPYLIQRVESGPADEIDIVSHGESDVTTSSGVFSQLMNPKGR